LLEKRGRLHEKETKSRNTSSYPGKLQKRGGGEKATSRMGGTMSPQPKTLKKTGPCPWYYRGGNGGCNGFSLGVQAGGGHVRQKNPCRAGVGVHLEQGTGKKQAGPYEKRKFSARTLISKGASPRGGPERKKKKSPQEKKLLQD